MTQELTIELTINEKSYQRSIPVRLTLADFLRHELNLTGTHVGCEHGVCGACTVLVDGRTQRACLTLAVQADGSSITTIEGLATGEELGPLQQAFMDQHALQCGFCTPGMVMSAVDLLQKNKNPNEQEIRDWLEGNICRCTGYQGIVEAVKDVASKM